MCEGRPSMLMTKNGQMIADELSNSHAEMAEKYLGDSKMEDECFQPELEIGTGKISVNKVIHLKMKDIDITDKIGKKILEYFNKKYNTVAKLRAAMMKTKQKKDDKFNNNWIETWKYFDQVLKGIVKSEIEGMENHQLTGKYRIITNDESEIKMLAFMEASKVRGNLKDIWQKPIKFTLEDINDKAGSPLFK